MADLLTPNTGNYTIGKAEVFFTKSGGSKRHLGNVSAAAFQLATDTLDHFSAMAGIKKKDKTATLQITGTLDMTLEEFNIDNVRLALFGGAVAADTSTEGDGDLGFVIGAVSEVTGEIEIKMTNDVGPKWTYIYPNVSMKPSGALDVIGDNWASMSLSADVLTHDYGSGVIGFGKAIQQGSAT